MLPNIVQISIFWLVQASALLVFTVPFRWPLVALWAASHFLRAIGLTLIFHRYLAHRAFKMNRVARFVWAFIGTAAMQKGPLWWAGHHVNHHKFADRDGDPHSPMVSGFYYAHIGWFLNDTRHDQLEASNPVIRDFGKAPELALLEQYFFVPPLLLAAAMYLARRLAVAGLRLLPADDDAGARDVRDQHRQPHVRLAPLRDASTSRATTPFTAFFAVGEGWHNNHHRYQRAARNGFYWWEFDPTWYVIRAMAAVGLAWDIQPRARSHLRRGARREGATAPPTAAAQRRRRRGDASLIR